MFRPLGITASGIAGRLPSFGGGPTNVRSTTTCCHMGRRAMSQLQVSSSSSSSSSSSKILDTRVRTVSFLQQRHLQLQRISCFIPATSTTPYWGNHPRHLFSTLPVGDDDDDDEYSGSGSRSNHPPPDTVIVPKFAVVRHDVAYQNAMNGLHGKQLALAQLEGMGKDEPDFDPFLEEELEEARLLAEQQEEDERRQSGKENSKSQDDLDEVEEEDDSTDTTAVTDTTDASSSQWYLYKQLRKKYNKDGSLKRNKSERAILRAGAPAGGRIAIIALSGTQFKVTTDDVIIMNLWKPTHKYKVGSIHTLQNEDVLLVSSSSLTLVGMPYVPGAQVDVLIEEITQDQKIVIFKKRRRKNSQRKTGFRRDVTMLRVLDIRYPSPYDTHAHVERPDPAPLIPK